MATVNLADLVSSPEKPASKKTVDLNSLVAEKPKAETESSSLPNPLTALNSYIMDNAEGLIRAGKKVRDSFAESKNASATAEISAAVGDSALNILTGMVAAPLALSKKLSDHMMSSLGMPVKKEEFSKSTKENEEEFTYSPRTKLGEALSETVGAGIKPLTDSFDVLAKGLAKVTPLKEDDANAVLQTLALLSPMFHEVAKTGVLTPEHVEKIKLTVDELATKNPEAASALVAKVKQADPKKGKELETQVEKAKVKTPEEQEIVGRDLAKVNTSEQVKLRAKSVGVTPEGKTRIQILSPEVPLAGIRSASVEAYDAVKTGPALPAGAEDPALFMQNGKPVKKSTIDAAFQYGLDSVRKIPGANVAEGKLKEYFQQLVKLSPELGGSEAKATAAILGKHQFERITKDVQRFQASEPRRIFWNHRMKEGLDFLFGVEEKKAFADPVLRDAAEAYKKMNEEDYQADAKRKIFYEPVENYMPRIFKDPAEAEKWLDKTYGNKWGDPAFTKDRKFTWLRDATKPKSQGGGGLELITTNPEELMLMRHAASNRAHMKVDFLEELASYGLARKAGKGSKMGLDEDRWRSPNGDIYFIKGPARQVMKNAFDEKSAWNWKGLHGDVFRGVMGLKNAIVPAMLQLSLFHPLHVTWGMYNSAIAARLMQETIAGVRSPASAFAGILKAQTLAELPKDLYMGGRVRKALNGKLDPSKLSPYEQDSLQRVQEGGLLVNVDSRLRLHGMEAMRQAFQRGEYWKLPFKTPSAFFQAIAWPTMEKMIPSLKTASYVKDTASLLKMNPELATDNLARMQAFRRTAKNVENRFGEMAYNQRFWNKAAKDIGIASTLSMGWEGGFLDEFGLGPLRGVSAVTKEGVKGAAKTGKLNQLLFVGSYITTAMMTSAVLTYFMTRTMPSGMDYFMPRNGEKNKDGTDARLNTPFYTREFASIYKHSQIEGAEAGVTDYFLSKENPVIGRAWDFMSNTNWAGHEISDPRSNAFIRLQQKLASEFVEVEPLAARALQQGGETSTGKVVGAITGFTPAPKYVTDTPTTAQIKTMYEKYVAPKSTPYEKAQFSDEAKKLRTAYDKGDMETYEKVKTKLQDKYGLTSKDEAKLLRQLTKGGDSNLYMFERLDWRQQKQLLDKMTEEERDKYLRHANKEHLRFSYEEPAA